MTDPRSIADLALSLPPGERPAFIDLQCAPHPGLRAQVEELLKEHLLAAGNATVATPPDQTIETPPPSGPGAKPGDRIDRYKLLELIGEGGFGSVYMAEQTEPVTRRVALKIIKLGMDTKQVIARFEAERQALAMMDHPSIARVLDAGSTAAGRPYFVMELVRGIPLTDYCDSVALSVRERLELFIDICGAVQHAHQKGIIHRDLKPSNIMVTLHDTRAVPKVIDFGIAKATTHRLTEKTLFTEFRQFVGTPQYMSPEQAEMSGLDVDTRSDVYSLGAILYELLTGQTPHEAQALMTAGIAGMSQMIRDVDPPGLSQRFTALGAERTTVAKRRGTEPDRLVNELRGDLQWIVSKALEKDRTRRYESASQLADDIRRSLANEPILAVPPSATYRLRKFVRRNRAWVVTAALLLVTVAAGLAVATTGWVEARSQLKRSTAMTEFLKELHIGFDPFQQDDKTGVDAIVERSKELFGEDNAAIGSLLFTRASLLTSWGRLSEAEEVLVRSLEFQRKSLGNDHEGIAATLKGLANVYSLLGRNDEARTAFEEALSIHKARFGPRSMQVAESAQSLAQLLLVAGDPADEEKVNEYFTMAIEGMRAARGNDDLRTLQAQCGYGLWLQAARRNTQAIEVLTDAIDRGRPQRMSLGDLWLGAVNALAVAWMVEGDEDKTAAYWSEVLELLRERGMSGGPWIAQLLRFSGWLMEAERMEEAETTLREAWSHGREFPASNDNRRDVLRDRVGTEAAIAEAEELLRAELAEIETTFEENAPARQRACEDLGRWLRSQGRLDEAKGYLPPDEFEE